MHFDAYASAGFLEDLLPLLPTDAEIHPDSPTRDNLLSSRGKVPGRKRLSGWVGFSNWTSYTACHDDMAIWQGWRAGIGLQGRRFPAVDIDVDDPELASAIHHEALTSLGAAPVRFGRGARRILVYSAPGLRKRRLAFASTGHPSGPEQAIELLGAGQQYVVAGIHPKTGEPYWWEDSQSLLDYGSGNLTVIDDAKIDVFIGNVEALLRKHGYAISRKSPLRGLKGGKRTVQPALLAPSLDLVREALAALPNEADYDDWIKVMAATKGATGGTSQGFELFAEWSAKSGLDVPATTRQKYDSFRGDVRLGWGWLSQHAAANGDGTFSAAQADFGDAARSAGAEADVAAMFTRFAWVERLKRVCDLETGELLDREQFNVKCNHIGDPSSSKECAWAVLTRDAARLQVTKSLTYRPGAGRLVEEALPGLVGLCVNTWRDPNPALPETATDADVSRWLDHVAVVIPDEAERRVVLDWFAWIIQNPGEKPNWALLIGSKWEGIGKDLMLEPVRVALGAENIREIGPGDIVSGWTWWGDRTRLVIVEEMHTFDRKETMNRLKPLIAAPPETLTINKKMEPQYEVPNIIASVFFSNMENALALSKQDRRFFVTWNDNEPRDKEHFAELVGWYASGGKELAARWLQLRDLTGFDAKGRAPATAAKLEMSIASRPVVEMTLSDAVAERTGPFQRRLVTLGEVFEWLRPWMTHGRALSPRSLSAMLQNAGALKFERRVSLGAWPGNAHRPADYDPRQTQLFAAPGDADALLLADDLKALRKAFWDERAYCHDDLGDLDEVAQ